MMNQGKSTSRKSSTSSMTKSKQKIINKNQLTSDSVFLIQNQNEILKLKNQQLASRIAALNMQVKQRQHRIAEKQQKCQQIRESISKSIFVKDIELENQKKLLQDKVTLGKQKIKTLQNKINDIRRQTVIQQDRIPILIQQRKKFQQELRIAKMENQGLKTVLINLEQQNQELRKNNNSLSLKKYSKEPEHKALSQEIQERIRIIKNLNVKEKVFKKEHSLTIIIKILQDLFFQRKKICFLTTQRHGLKKSLIKKKLFLLTLIRKKYINFVKSSVMSILRQSLNPLQQEQKCVRILQDMRKRREKGRIWRIWRNQTAKAEYSLIRKFESQTVIQKIGRTILKRLVIVGFEKLKYFKNDYRREIAISKMFAVLSKVKRQPLRQFLSILSRENYQYQIQKDIQTSAQDQSKTLILSRIFYGWLAMMKDKKKQSLTLKFKYFNELKKIFVIKKRNVLNEMLGETKIRLNEVNIKSICFAALKKQFYQVKEKRIFEEKERLMLNFTELQQDTENRVIMDEQIDKQRALIKVQKYLQRKVKQTLNIWRKQNKRVYAVQKMYSLILFYVKKSVNFAFSRIQIRRFQKLKISIKDKIESCDYSYNYLVEENNHIKEVLDTKSHELEKAKFVTIIRRLIRQQKEIKQKYFYKFLKNGYKFWKVKKSLQNIDSLMKKKISLVFMFLLKINKTQKLQLQKVQKWTQKKDNKITNQLLKSSMKGLKFCVERNKRMRRALMGVFDRNIELNCYQAYGKIRDQSFQFELHQIQQHHANIEQQIKQTNQSISMTIQTIDILTERLKTKQQIFRQRKTMSIYQFFAKNIKKNVGQYIWKWKNKVDEEKRIINFVKNLEKKTESIVKNKLFSAIQKTKQELSKKYLQNKLQKYTFEYEHANENFEKFLSTSEQRIAAMEIENEKNDQIIIEYQKKTDHMNDVKVESFLKRWDKNICKFVFRQWKKQKFELVKSWERVFNVLRIASIRDPFQTLSSEVRQTLVHDRIKKNLNKVTTKAYLHNVGVFFKIWRNVNINKKVKQNEQILKLAMVGREHIEQHLKDLKKKYNNQINRRITLWKLRRMTNVWRIYTERKLNNNKKYEQLTNWIQVGYSAQIISLFRRHKNKSLNKKNTIANFKQQAIIKRAKTFLQYLYKVRLSKHIIERLFINKFCYHEIHQLSQQFFSRIKNYQRFKEIKEKDHKTFCIQKVIDAFQKKRKGILCQNMRMWRRNMYLMKIEKNLLKRLVRKAMNNRVKDLFYSWKAEASARSMVIEHTEEGQVKKRKIQIQRLKKYIDDFKKEKGLLLENEQGDFVVSPRFQEKKEKQLKRSNLLKYKFVSRLILSMNGYEAPVKAWTNLQMLSKLRVKVQKCALMARNRMQKGDLYTAFKIWHNDTKQLRRQFEEMQRKDLIRLLNRQKDRMEIQYGKKIDVEQKVEKQLRRYKLLSYQDKRKERIFAQILFRQARKVKSFAFDTWRERAKELENFELHDLQQRGNNKLLSMDDQVQDLEKYYRDLEENNRMLRSAVQQALQLADMIKKISEERDQLQRELTQSDISCESLQAQNQQLNNKLILAQKQAMNLLTLSNKGV